MTRYERQKGLSLVELMVALVLSLFLLAGVVTIFVNTKVGYSGQQALAALQENERLAASVLSNTVRQAGYFPWDPISNARSYAFPPNGAFADGQVIYGTGSTIMVRYVTAPNDGLIDCNGVTNTGTSNYSVTETISLNSGSASLECAVNSPVSNNQSQPIISPLGSQPFNPNGGGVSGMQVLYGVAPISLTASSINRYLTASQVSSGDLWMQVQNVLITLDFVNPLYDPNHPNGQSPTLSMTRVIYLQNLAQ